jgi:hypothetical protein
MQEIESVEREIRGIRHTACEHEEQNAYQRKYTTIIITAIAKWDVRATPIAGGLGYSTQPATESELQTV